MKKEEIINSEFYKQHIELLKNNQMIYIGGSKYYGLDNERSDTDLIIVNSEIKNFGMVYFINNEKIDVFFTPTIYQNKNIFQVVSLYCLLNDCKEENLILKPQFNIDKNKLRELIIEYIKTKKKYLNNPNPKKKINYHLCVISQLLKGEELNKEKILEVKNQKIINDFCKEQFQYLLNL